MEHDRHKLPGCLRSLVETIAQPHSHHLPRPQLGRLAVVVAGIYLDSGSCHCLDEMAVGQAVSNLTHFLLRLLGVP